MGRFLNADGILSPGVGLTGTNLFIYAANNPVTNVDIGGFVASFNTMLADTGGSKYLPLPTGKNNNPKVLVAANTGSDSKKLPKTGNPGSKDTIRNPDGTPKQDRWYGPDGNPERDRDYNHPGEMPFPHDHDWENGKRGKGHLPPAPEYQFNWEPIVGLGLLTACVIVIVVVAADDITGIGVADDFLFGPLGVGVAKGTVMVFGQ